MSGSRWPFLGSYAWSLVPRAGRRSARWVLFAQGRTGSTLFGALLSSHPSVVFGDEILYRHARWPAAVVRGESRRHGGRVYGFHVKPYQLTDDQHVADVGAWLRRLHDDGWQVFHLWRRNVVRQVLSNMVAEQRGAFHVRGEAAAPAPALHVDVDVLLHYAGRRQDVHAEELDALAGLAHKTFCYEDDLLDPSAWQATADRAFNALGLDPVPVSSTLRRTNDQPLDALIANHAEVVEALSGTPLEAFLDEGRSAGG